MKIILSFSVVLVLIVTAHADDNKKKKQSAPSKNSHSQQTPSAGGGASRGGSAPHSNVHQQSGPQHSAGGQHSTTHGGTAHSGATKSGAGNSMSAHSSGNSANSSQHSNPLMRKGGQSANAANGNASNPMTKQGKGSAATANAHASNPMMKKTAQGNNPAGHGLSGARNPAEARAGRGGLNNRLGARGPHALHANYHVRPYREVFHNYRRVYHDRFWYRGHYDNVVIVGGGYYYWDGGYWYPAWGYDPAFTFYAYDGPIYSYQNLPPDQVVVNVQTALQDQGYYTGDVDGQLGPKTRDAVAAYQRDHDLEVTAAIDEPTVDSLGLS